MSLGTQQFVIGIIVILAAFIIAGAIFLYPVFSNRPLDDYAKHAGLFLDNFQGIIGVIVGYFFAQIMSSRKPLAG